MQEFLIAERRNLWTPEQCDHLATSFTQAREDLPALRGRSLYNEGLVWLRCGRLSRAQERFQEASEGEPQARRMLMRLLLSEGGDEKLARARALLLGLSNFSAEDAGLLVESYRLGARSRERLAMAEEASRLAVHQFHTHAPLHNQRGVLLVALKQVHEGEKSFIEALRLDPTLFEAWMNLGALRLVERRANDAAKAYEVALRLRRDDYDAHLGLALARRLQAPPVPGSEHVPQLRASQALLERAIALDPERPEAYFNEAVLLDIIASAQDPVQAIPEWGNALRLYQTFLDRSTASTEQAAQRRRASRRIEEMTCMRIECASGEFDDPLKSVPGHISW